MKSFISFLADAYMAEATCNCETCRDVTEGKKMTPQQKFTRHPKIAAIIKKLEAVVKKNKLVAEGSARGAEQRRGVYAKSREIHLQDVLSREKSRGIDADNPHTDARKLARIHTQPYNVGKAHSAGKK